MFDDDNLYFVLKTIWFLLGTVFVFLLPNRKSYFNAQQMMMRMTTRKRPKRNLFTVCRFILAAFWFWCGFFLFCILHHLKDNHSLQLTLWLELYILALNFKTNNCFQTHNVMNSILSEEKNNPIYQHHPFCSKKSSRLQCAWMFYSGRVFL